MAGYPYRVDTHEMLKRAAFAPTPQARSHFLPDGPNPKKLFGVSDQYLVLDTALCEDAKPGQGEYKFNVLSQQGGSIGRTVGVRDPLNSVIEIQTFAFTVPLPVLVTKPTEFATLTLASVVDAPDPDDDLDPVGGLRSQLAQGTRVTLYIPEVGVQSFYDFKGRRHHFEYEASLLGAPGAPDARMLLTPINDLFIFTTPITDLLGISMHFSSPDARLRFPADEFRRVYFSTDALLRIVVNIADDRSTDLRTILQRGDRIFFDNVQFTSALGNELSIFLNRDEGMFVGEAGLITPTTFVTDPSITAPAFVGNAVLPTVGSAVLRVAKNRIRAPFRVRRIVDGGTNFIDPT
jgi:hypothetical protein